MALFGAMHPPRGAVRRIWFGHDDRNLYLRFDLLDRGGASRAVELEMLFSAGPGRRSAGDGDAGGLQQGTGRGSFGFDPAFRLTARRDGVDFQLELRETTPKLAGSEPLWAGRATAAEALAFAVPFEALGQDPGERLEMVALAYEDGKPVEQLPPTGSIAVRVPGDVFHGGEDRPAKNPPVSAQGAPLPQGGALGAVGGA